VAQPGTPEAAAPPRVGWRPGNRREVVGLIVLAAVSAGLLGQIVQWGTSDLILPLVLLAAGLGVVWRQLDTDRPLDLPGGRWALAGGAVLAAGGVVLLLATTGQLAAARNGFVATLVILIGVVLVAAPIWRRLLDSRAEERTARFGLGER